MKRKYFMLIFFILFFVLLSLYLTNNINVIDNYFYNLIIGFKSDYLTKFMLFITSLASTRFIFLVMLVFLCKYFISRKKIFLITNALILGEVIINNVIKLIIGRERPELINLVTETTYSFPSGHSMVAVVFYGFIIYLVLNSRVNKYLKIFINCLLVILIFLILISRIYLGAHYFSDVFAGMSLSISYLLFMINILERRNLL